MMSVSHTIRILDKTNKEYIRMSSYYRTVMAMVLHAQSLERLSISLFFSTMSPLSSTEKGT